MKKLLLILALFVSLNANAEVSFTRGEIGTALSETVTQLKNWFSDSEKDLNKSLEDSSKLKETAINLKERSEDPEVNPKVLDHGNAVMHSPCEYKTENLQWVNDKWECVPVTLNKDCEGAASDEYEYPGEDGKTICSKNPEGGSINYYWQFRGYSNKCSVPSTGYDKLYDCVYKNKQNGTVQVADAYCKGSKPNVAKKTCVTTWRVGSWGSCSESCGGGVKYRSVYCPTHYTCSGAKPGTSTSCNTQSCSSCPPGYQDYKGGCCPVGANCSGGSQNSGGGGR